jgi:hypothetical protein
MKGKGFNFKQIAITHGEKIVLGVAGVLALFVLLKTTWGTYQKQPAALKKAAEDASTLIASTKWPAAEAGKYPPNDTLGIQIGSMLTPIPGNTLVTSEGPGYELSIPGSFSLYRREKPMTDPKYLPVRNLIATATRMVIAKRNESFVFAEGAEPGPAGGTDPTGAAAPKKPKRGAFRRRSGAAGEGPDGIPMGEFGAPPMGGAGRRPTGARPYGPMAAGARPYGPMAAGARPYGPMAAGARPYGPMGPMGAMMDAGSTAMGEGGGGQAVEADGQRVVTVRGIYPIREQMREYEKKLHLPEGYNPLDYIRIKDFILERAVSTDGGKTFSKWTEVDKKANVEYLKTKVADFDTDTVATGVTHYVITSPLPMRLLREWGDEATHPELDRYKLSREGQRRQRVINEAVQEQKKRLKKFKEESESGGFGAVQRNMAGDRSAVMQDQAGEQGFQSYINEQMSQMYPAGDAEGFNRGTMLSTFKAEANAAGDLVLFRYFDFNVLPGRTYKYRVKLTLYNLLYGLPAEKLALESQGSNKDEYRQTKFSNETTPATVPRDVDYFIDHITDRRSLRMDAPSVTMSVYEWMPKLGTVVRGNVTDLEPGQMIAGKDSKTKRYDPAKEILFINEESEFNSNSVLLDLKAGQRKLDDRHMRELGLPAQLKVTAPDEIIVVDELGRLKQLDPLSTKHRHSEVERLQNEMLTEFKNLELDRAAVNEAATAGEEGAMADSLDSPVGKAKKKTRKRGKRSKGNSPLRRGAFGSRGYGPNGGFGSGMGNGPSAGHGAGPGQGPNTGSPRPGSAGRFRGGP